MTPQAAGQVLLGEIAGIQDQHTTFEPTTVRNLNSSAPDTEPLDEHKHSLELGNNEVVRSRVRPRFYCPGRTTMKI